MLTSGVESNAHAHVRSGEQCPCSRPEWRATHGAMSMLTSDEAVPIRGNAHVHVEARGSASAWSGSASG